ncbi:hypothetical protein CRV24_003889 [Beauveria bassiana]|nr:hypothetical protein CRV24_003889 [Beauveria bassiana]KAH8710487.1 hypothetical protein HC256_007326 [Beauveria bassiana]
MTRHLLVFLVNHLLRKPRCRHSRRSRWARARTREEEMTLMKMLPLAHKPSRSVENVFRLSSKTPALSSLSGSRPNHASRGSYSANSKYNLPLKTPTSMPSQTGTFISLGHLGIVR